MFGLLGPYGTYWRSRAIRVNSKHQEAKNDGRCGKTEQDN